MSERAMRNDEQRLGVLPAERDRLEQGGVEPVSEREIEGRDVTGGPRVGLERFAECHDGGGQITPGQRGRGKRNRPALRHCPYEGALGSHERRDERLARPQRAAGLLHRRRRWIDELSVGRKLLVDLLEEADPGALERIDLLAESGDGPRVLPVGGLAQRLREDAEERADLLLRVLLSSYQVRQRRRLCRRPRRAGVEGALHALAPGDVGQPERLGGGVDAGITLEARAANVGEQTDVRGEDHAEPLIAGGPARRFVVRVHRSREQDGNGIRELPQRHRLLAARGFGHRLQRPSRGCTAVLVAEQPLVPLERRAEDFDRLIGPPRAQERDTIAQVVADVGGVGLAGGESDPGRIVDCDGLGPTALAHQRVPELTARKRQRQGIIAGADLLVDLDGRTGQRFSLLVASLFQDDAGKHPDVASGLNRVAATTSQALRSAARASFSPSSIRPWRTRRSASRPRKLSTAGYLL